MNKKLRDCPFCEGKPEIKTISQIITRVFQYQITCQKCLFTTRYCLDKQFLIDVWNNRKPTDNIIKHAAKKLKYFENPENLINRLKHKLGDLELIKQCFYAVGIKLPIRTEIKGLGIEEIIYSDGDKSLQITHKKGWNEPIFMFGIDFHENGSIKKEQ